MALSVNWGPLCGGPHNQSATMLKTRRWCADAVNPDLDVRVSMKCGIWSGLFSLPGIGVLRLGIQGSSSPILDPEIIPWWMWTSKELSRRSISEAPQKR